MSEYQRRKAKGEAFEAALVVCGRKEKYEMIPEVKDMVLGLDGAPVSKFWSLCIVLHRYIT